MYTVWLSYRTCFLRRHGIDNYLCRFPSSLCLCDDVWTAPLRLHFYFDDVGMIFSNMIFAQIVHWFWDEFLYDCWCFFDDVAWKCCYFNHLKAWEKGPEWWSGPQRAQDPPAPAPCHGFWSLRKRNCAFWHPLGGSCLIVFLWFFHQYFDHGFCTDASLNWKGFLMYFLMAFWWNFMSEHRPCKT